MKLFRLLFTSWLVISIVVGAVSVCAAQSSDQIVHVVQPGENLYRISLRYGMTVDDIMAANGLSDAHTIYAGQGLVIPTESEAEVLDQSLGTGAAATYIVQPGDTLTGIALQHGVTIWMIVPVNGLSNPHVVYSGQELMIPPSPAHESLQNPPAEDSSSGSDMPSPSEDDLSKAAGTYVVQPGDNLYRIAQRFATTVAALAYLNGITNPSQIHTGQILRLVGDVPAGAEGEKYILVDLSEQHLYAYQGDQLVFSFVASSGAAPTFTRAGEFHVQSKIPNAYGATWDIWMPHWLGIYWAGGSENGIHALPILANGQTLWAGYLGTPISYGCIVLGTYEASVLYDWADMGTPVTIQP